MKTKIYSISMLCITLALKQIDAQSFQKGQKDVNIGLGLGNGIVATGGNNVTPPISFSFDYGITGDISLGGYLGFTGASYSYSGWENCGKGNGNGQYWIDTYSWRYFILGLRGAYHFGRFINVDKLDLYAGLLLGDDYARYTFTTTSTCSDHIRYLSPTYGGFVFSVFAGARYRFSDHFGVFTELGYGIAYLNLGLNLIF